jgi:hypothetical protein
VSYNVLLPRPLPVYITTLFTPVHFQFNALWVDAFYNPDLLSVMGLSFLIYVF